METKEKIKSRMLKNAAKIWGFKDTELESSYDPLVGLLMGSVANELEKISDEIDSSQARILDRLAQLLTPDTLTGSKPAHAIAHARPSEFEYKINRGFQLFTPRKMPGAVVSAKDSTKDIFFSPSSTFTLFNGDVQYIAAGNSFYALNNSFQKEPIFDSERGRQIDPYTLWIGLDLHGKIKTLNGLRFYFDMKNDDEKSSFLHHLPLARWTVNDREVKTVPGFDNADSASILNEIDITSKTEAFTNSYYKIHFVTISDTSNAADTASIVNQKYPPEFETVFALKDLQKIPKAITWVKLVFPSSLSAGALTDAFCAINCFPVVNRKNNKFSYRLQENLNILPLSSKDIFFDMKAVYNTDGIMFESKPVTNHHHLEVGTYMLRHGGVGRFDSRSASEILEQLIDLLRDESAAFSAMGNEVLSSEITQLNYLLASLEQKIGKNSETKETISYLMIKSRGTFENIFVEFWSTNGELANNIRPGTKLNVYSGGDLETESVMLITGAGGGRDKLNAVDSLNVYKEAILNRGRIITPQDIRSVCFSELGEMISDVKVKKGVALGSDTKSGLVRTIDVWLTPANSGRYDKEEWKRMCHELQVTIENQSAGMYPFRVLINN